MSTSFGSHFTFYILWQPFLVFTQFHCFSWVLEVSGKIYVTLCNVINVSTWFLDNQGETKYNVCKPLSLW
jgi:hypothetical protein